MCRNNGKPPHYSEKEWRDTENTFAGISGEPVPGLGSLVQSAQISRLKIKWHGNIIGGEGSYCANYTGTEYLHDGRCRCCDRNEHTRRDLGGTEQRHRADESASKMKLEQHQM